MDYQIKTYDPQFLESQVELGQLIMDGWKFQSQSTLDHLKRVYTRDDFQSDTRLHALLNDQLVGFQTSHVLAEAQGGEIIGRMEFPIVDPKHTEVVELLQNQSEENLRRRGATLLRVRVSPYWGKTEEYAHSFGFSYEKPHLMTTETRVRDLQTKTDPSYSIILINPENESHKKLFAEIFPQRFPMRYEGEVNEWFTYYSDQKRLVWLLLMDGDTPLGHLVGFERDDACAITAFFTIGDQPEKKLRELMTTANELLQESDVKKLTLSIGDAQIPYVGVLQELGLDMVEQISYYIKRV